MTPTCLQWLELPAPHEALASLHANGELARLLPEVEALYGVPQNPLHHPEVDTGVHTELCLQLAERLGASPRARFAVLTHDLGKALTPSAEWPKHVDHELRGIEPVRAVCERLAVPEDWQALALLVCEYHLHAHRAFEMRSTSVVKFLQQTRLDSEVHPLFEDFIIACEADKRGRTGKEDKPYDQGAFLRAAMAELRLRPYPEGADMYAPAGVKVYGERLTAVRRARDPYRDLRSAPAVC